MFDAADPKAFRRQSRGTYSASFYELDAVPDDVLKASYPMLVRTLANVVVLHVPGRGVWFTTMERGTYEISDDPAEVFERLAPLAKSKLVIDNEFVRGSRARAVGRRRGHRGHLRGRQAHAGARPATRPVPRSRVSQRARPPSRHAPLSGRRALVRQPLGAQGRDPVLDERQRRRQVAARGGGARHPARDRLRRAERAHASSACPRGSSRGGCRSTRSSTG